MNKEIFLITSKQNSEAYIRFVTQQLKEKGYSVVKHEGPWLGQQSMDRFLSYEKKLILPPPNFFNFEHPFSECIGRGQAEMLLEAFKHNHKVYLYEYSEFDFKIDSDANDLPNEACYFITPIYENELIFTKLDYVQNWAKLGFNRDSVRIEEVWPVLDTELLEAPLKKSATKINNFLISYWLLMNKK